MSYNIGLYNRYITFQTPTDVNTKGSLTRTWTTVFTGYAMKEDSMRTSASNTSEENGNRTTLNKEVWKFPYNEGITKDGRFYEGNAPTKYYYVVGLVESDYQTEMTVQTELRV